MGLVAVLLVCAATGPALIDVRNLNDLLDLVKGPEDLVVDGNIHDLVLGQNLPDLALEPSPLIGAPEVIYSEEAAGKEIAPKPLDLGGTQLHVGNFYRID